MYSSANSIGPATIINSPAHHAFNFQNTNTPDIDLDRDVIEPEAEALLGIGSTNMSNDKRFRVNLSTIIISAIIFLMILAWFDFMQTAFFSWLSPETQIGVVPASVKLWYAFLATIIVIIIVTLIYFYFHNHIK